MAVCSEMAMCVKCRGKNKPKIVKIDGLYYVQCPCNKWDRYCALGLKAEYAIEVWNRLNKPMKGRWNEFDDL